MESVAAWYAKVLADVTVVIENEKALIKRDSSNNNNNNNNTGASTTASSSSVVTSSSIGTSGSAPRHDDGTHSHSHGGSSAVNGHSAEGTGNLVNLVNLV